MNWEDIARKLAYDLGIRALEIAALRSDLEATQRHNEELTTTCTELQDLLDERKDPE